MDLDDLIKAGRVAPVFCRLARQRFSGVVFVEHAEQGGIFSFRDGDPVFVEDLGDNDEGIPDQLVAEGLVTAQQYTEIATRVTEALVESEEVAFCQVAVELGILSQERVNTILQRRVKGRVIQAIGWSGCEIEVDDDPDGLAGILEYPQELGPLVYMGVRTFFDEEQISEIVGRRGQTYLRLAGAVDEPVEFFGLDDEERNLLERLLPDVSVEAAMEAARVDPLDAWQVVCLLSIAGFVELSDVPFSAPSEGSGVRDTSAMRAAAGRYTGGAVSEERVGVRPPARHPAAEGRVAGARAPARPPVAEERTGVRGPARPPVAEERVGPAARANGSRSDARPSASDAAGAAARRGRDAQAPVRSVDDSARSSSSQGRPTPPGQRIRERRRRPRKLSTALKRLDRELKNRRPASGPQASSAASKGQPPRRAHTPASTPKGSGSASRQDRAHIKALLRMRQASLTKRIRSENVAPPPKDDPEQTFRALREALREQTWSRALQLATQLRDSQPDTMRSDLYFYWASWRAQKISDSDMSEFRKLLRDATNDEVHRPFAAYVLGHLALAENKEDAAERYFRKAVELDKKNTDAERFLRILELKKKTAEQEEKGSKIFGIEITRSKK